MNLFYKIINSKNWLKKMFLFQGFTTFQIKDGSKFRFTGFYYIYQFKDGNERKFQPCKRKYGNAAGGTGICGWYTEFENITITSIKFTKAKWTCRKYEGHDRFVKRSEDSFKFLYSMPTGLTSKEYNELAMDRAVEAAMKSFKK